MRSARPSSVCSTRCARASAARSISLPHTLPTFELATECHGAKGNSMLKIIGIIVIILVIAFVALLAYAATKPDTFTVKRAASIKAPPQNVFPLISDFKNWPQWSPWETRDPNLKRTYSGAADGKGAKYAWEGNRNVGSGEMEIIDTAVPNKIII